MTKPENIIRSLAEHAMQVQEKPAKLKEKQSNLFIGIPKARSYGEKRVPLTPKSVATLIARGHKVLIESDAGKNANYSDNDYSEAGAQIAYGKKDIFGADLVLKMSPISEDELEFLDKGQIVMSPIHLPKLQPKLVQRLLESGVIAMAYEYIKDEVKNFPIVHALSEIAGRAAVLIAGDILNNYSGGKGQIIGGITGVPPTKVIVLGAGTVGESAARAAMGFGAIVKVFDDNVYKLRRLQNNLGTRLFTSVLNPQVLEREMMSADIVIGAIHSKTGRTPVVVTEAMVQKMPKDSVVIDVSIDQGGVFETSEVTTLEKPTFKVHDVIHYCVPNIASIYAQTASNAISNILTPILIEASEEGGFDNYIHLKKGIRKGVYVYRSKLTNEYISDKFHMKYTDLELLMATGFGG